MTEMFAWPRADAKDAGSAITVLQWPQTTPNRLEPASRMTPPKAVRESEPMSRVLCEEVRSVA